MVRKYNKINVTPFITLLIIITLFYYPLGKILFQGINIENFSKIIFSGYYRKIILFTISQSFISAFLSVLIAIPGSYFISRYNFFGKKIFLSLSSLPFIVPSILTVLGFVLLFGNNGIINNLLINIFNLDKPPLQILYSIKAILLAHIFYNFPLAIRIISSLWKKIPEEFTEASRTLGVNSLRSFFKVTLPYLRNGIYTSFTLIFLYCFMSFGIILVLGGGPSLSTIEVEVYRFAKISLNIPMAATLALFESVITITVLFLYIKGERKSSFLTGNYVLKKIPKIEYPFLFMYLIPLGLIIIAPLITIFIYSFFEKTGGFSQNINFSLKWYRSILGLENNRFSSTAILAIRNSFILASIVTFFSVPLGTLISYNFTRLKNNLLYQLIFLLPMGISSIIIGLSYLTNPTSGSYLSLVIAQVFIALPLTIRSINNVYKNIDTAFVDSSRILGCNRIKSFFKIELPLLKDGIISGSVFSFAISLGEMNASIMLAPTGFKTIPLAIYQLIGSYNFMGACALGSILLLVSLLCFRFMDEF